MILMLMIGVTLISLLSCATQPDLKYKFLGYRTTYIGKTDVFIPQYEILLDSKKVGCYNGCSPTDTDRRLGDV